MKRIAALLLLAGVAVPSSRAADPRRDPTTPVPIPTQPSVPTPTQDPTGAVVPASALSRVMPAVRDRAGYAPTQAVLVPHAAMPLPTGMVAGSAVVGGCVGPTCGTPCRDRGSCAERFKAWLCFCPTAGDALPKLNPQPYVGPVAGTFPCRDSAACGAGGSPCATGAGPERCGPLVRNGSVFGGRSCKGGCVTPADDAIPGYRFAAGPSVPPAVAGAVAAIAPPGYSAAKPVGASAVNPVRPASHPARP